MTCATVEVNVGGPTDLNVVGAVIGAPWRLPMTFSDDVDLSEVTDATISIVGGTEEGNLTIAGDLTNKADGVILFELAGDDTSGADAGAHPWKLRLTGGPNDGWVPLRGLWAIEEAL